MPVVELEKKEGEIKGQNALHMNHVVREEYLINSAWKNCAIRQRRDLGHGCFCVTVTCPSVVRVVVLTTYQQNQTLTETGKGEIKNKKRI